MGVSLGLVIAAVVVFLIGVVFKIISELSLRKPPSSDWTKSFDNMAEGCVAHILSRGLYYVSALLGIIAGICWLCGF